MSIPAVAFFRVSPNFSYIRFFLPTSDPLPTPHSLSVLDLCVLLPASTPLTTFCRLYQLLTVSVHRFSDLL